MPPNKNLLSNERAEPKSLPVTLNKRQRELVAAAIRNVCKHRNYPVYAINVRTNHAHVVVASLSKPEIVMNSFKSYATRKLREEHLIKRDIKPWARHGSTRYLWTEEQLAQAIEYVLFGQGDEPFR